MTNDTHAPLAAAVTVARLKTRAVRLLSHFILLFISISHFLRV